MIKITKVDIPEKSIVIDLHSDMELEVSDEIIDALKQYVSECSEERLKILGNSMIGVLSKDDISPKIYMIPNTNKPLTMKYY